MVSLGSVRFPLGFRMLTFLLVLNAAAVAAEYEGKPIAKVEFDPAEQPLPRDELDRLLPLKPGSALRMSDVRSAIQALFSTGRFTNVVVDAQPEGEGVSLRIITERAWFVGPVSFEGGSEPPSKGQLASAAKLEAGAPFLDSDIPNAIEGLKDRFRANGLYGASVKPTVEKHPETEEVFIRFDIDPGNRAKFDGVNLTGNSTQPPEAVIAATRWRRGIGWIQPKFLGWRQVTESRVQTGLTNVRKFFQRGDHLLARVTLERMEYIEERNRVIPTLNLQVGPEIEVRTTGAKVRRGKLKELVPIYQERSVDRNLLVEGQRNLLEHFQSKGFFDATVDFSVLPEDNGRQVIEYYCDRGDKHKFVHLEILGNKYFDTSTIRERMYVMPATFLRFRNGRYGRRMLERDLDAIRDLYRGNGFREVEVNAAVNDDYQGKHGNIAAVVDIREGDQWFVSQLEVEGISDVDRKYITTLLQSTEGQPFSELNVAADRDTILGFYYNNGYPDTTFDWQQTPGPGSQRVSLKFIVHPGERQFVRAVLIRGLKTSDEGLVASRVYLSPGDALAQNKIGDTQRALYDLGIFAKVQTAIQNPEGEEERKYVLLHVDEASKYSFNAAFGAEIGRIGGGTSLDSPAGAGGFAPRVSLGISRLNFLGLGHTIGLQTRASTFQRRALVNYLAPQFKGNPDLSLSFSALFDDSRDVRTFAAKRWEGSAQLAHRLSRANTVQYRLVFRRVTVDENSIQIDPALVPIFSQPVRVGSFAVTFLQDRRDDPTNSRKGYYNSIDAGAALRQLFSKTAFTRLLMRNSSYHPIGRDMILARSLQFGWLQRIGGLPEIPLPERFFGGGATSHRGFPENQAGPRDLITGFPLGGSGLLFHSIELRFPLIGDNLGGVLFHDAGNVYSDVRNIRFGFSQRDREHFDYMVHSVGMGIRYRTPVGPIRFDLGFSPNSPRFRGFSGTRDELLAGLGEIVDQRINRLQFHFSIGQTF